MRFKWMIFIPILLFGEMGFVEPWGKDAGIQIEQASHISSKPLNSLARLSEILITFHQNHLSKTTGPRSHFKPSSSHYTLEAIRQNGFLRGWLMGFDRLMRENADPWVYATRWKDERWYKWDPPIKAELKRQYPSSTSALKYKYDE